MSYITTLEFPDDDYNAYRIIKENKKIESYINNSLKNQDLKKD